jgi:glycosyltransferase involved in cell wall biosynthesis
VADGAANSRRDDHLIRAHAFARMTPRLKVLCLVLYPQSNASVRLRFEQQCEELAKHGVDLTLSSFLDEPGYQVAFRPGHVVAKVAAVARGFTRRLADSGRVREFDLLLVYRESTPFGPRFVEAAASVAGVPVVVDFDEAIFVSNIHPANRRWAWLRDPGRLRVGLRSARAVTAQNEYLAAFARRFNSRVAVVPTPVDTDARRPRKLRQPGPVVIGWLGSETTAPYVHLVDETLARLSEESDVIVRVVGGAYSNPQLRRVDVRDFSLDREQSDLDTFDIGILPEPDDQWTKGKGGYKALLYMAAGIPVVASRVGVNPDIVADGETGYCVETTDDWLAALRRLISDEDLRTRLGSAGRVRAVERFSVAVIAAQFAAALRDAVEAAP